MMKRIPILAAAVAALLLTVCSCEGEQSSEPVTLMVQAGMNRPFFDALVKGAKDDLGIDLRIVFRYSQNSSTQMLEDFVHDNLKGDLIFTAAKIPDEYLKETCLDFVDKSNLVSNYTYERTRDFITDDGRAFQLPLSSKLIGITYNATLFERLGWDLPKNYEDMLELKRRCDEAGRTFAVCEMRLSGNPFNYLFHLTGTQWLSTVAGESWLDGFLEGKKTLYPFKKEAEYFRKWTENGLWGELSDGVVSPVTEFHRKQALFLYTVTNRSAGFGNEVYKAMPWISEDGSNNCFTMYYNFWVMANRHLADKGQEKHLQDVISVLDYMMTDKYLRMILMDSRDSYRVFEEDVVDAGSLFYDELSDIGRGFIQPWYYNRFEDPTIIATGTEIGSYMVNEYRRRGRDVSNCKNLLYDLNPEANFDSAIAMLRISLHSLRDDYLGWAEEYIGSPKLAELTAISGGISLQKVLDDTGRDAEVSVALMPYINDVSELQPWITLPIQAAEVFPGSLPKAYRTILISSAFINGVWMTGAQIKAAVAEKYDPSDYYRNSETGVSSFDIEHYGPFAYACVTKNGIALEDDREYLVAVPQRGLTRDRWDQLLKDGKILMDGDAALLADSGYGIEQYFDKHEEISNSNIVWDWE